MGGRFEIGTVAGGRYEILRFLAAGGMGEVYAARDTVLDTTVALKTLKPELEGSSAALERFRREVALARNVTDPHVCRLYDVGEHAGHVFLTMELLEGTRLAPGMPFAELERVAQQLVRGLAALHAAGVVHRDFKTSNVIRVGDRVVITDFGLARSTLGDDAKLTLESGLLGTPAYMAPEQVEGRPATPASDVYALGVVLFELVTGRLPFLEDTAMAAATARLLRDPPRPSSVRTGIPARWDSIILRCLARDPAARPKVEKVLAVRDRSRRWMLAAGGIGAAALAAGGLAVKRISEQRAPGRPLAPQHVIAMLPVGTLEAFDAAALFADPVRLAITIDLYELFTTVGFPVVDIYSPAMDTSLRGPAMKWAAAKEPLDAAFALAHVDRVIEPRLERDGDTVALIVRTTYRDRTSMSRRFTRKPAEVSRLAYDAAIALCTRDGDFGKPRFRDPPMTPAQYTRYGQGLADLWRPIPDAERSEWEAQKRGRTSALRGFSSEIPKHARSAAMVAEWHLARAEQQEVFADTTKQLKIAHEHVDRALAADPDQALAHATRGHAAMLEWNWKLADEATRRAVELSPTYGRIAHFHRPFLLQLLGRFDELFALEQRDLPVDERLGEATLGYYFYYARRFDEAVRVLAPKLDAFDYSSFVECIWATMLALSYAELGRHHEALAAADKLYPKLDNYARAALIPVYVLAGRVDDAKAKYAKVLEAGLDLGQQAIIDDALGDHEAALAKLEQAVASHNIHALFLKIERYSTAIRQQPRFHALMQKIGFLS